MKYSEAMLKGFQQVGGRQCKGNFEAVNSRGERSCCAAGAVGLGSDFTLSRIEFLLKFDGAWGVDAAVLNDEGVPWEHIYGMAVAADL